MQVQKLNSCCSSAYLYDAHYDLFKYNKQYLLHWLNEQTLANNIVYISNHNWRQRLTLWWIHGFKCKGSYIGFGGARVYILVKQIR